MVWPEAYPILTVLTPMVGEGCGEMVGVAKQSKEQMRGCSGISRSICRREEQSCKECN